MPVTKKALKESEVCEYLGLSHSFLRNARMERMRGGRPPGPAFIRIGRTVRYLVEDLDAWLASYRCEPPDTRGREAPQHPDSHAAEVKGE